MTIIDPRQSARSDFEKARKDAILFDLYNRMLGRSTDLFSFDEVKRKLGGIQGSSAVRREIRLDAIVGSVGRYADFNRDFLPRYAFDQERWAGVKIAMETKSNIPPIDVYRVGEVYFVADGNHRVSIAKLRGDTYIMANVTEIITRVGLSPDDTPQDLITKAEYNDFLDRTKLDDTAVDVDLRASEIGLYPVLLQQIETLRAAGEALTFPEAALAWYNDHYLPVIEVLREQNLLRHYPNRTETDLYAWLVENREALEEEFGWTLHLDSVAAELAARKQSPGRLRGTLRQILDPESETGGWRERQLAGTKGKMFADIVVLLKDASIIGPALEIALTFAAQEDSHLLGLFIRQNGDRNSQDFTSAQQAFENLCREAGIFGQLATGKGERNDILKARTRWADLAVLPAPEPSSDPRDYHELLENIHIPALIARPSESEIRRMLLAFDDSPKSREALFMSAYLSGLWGLELSVISVDEGRGESAAAETALEYLDGYKIDNKVIQATLKENDSVAATILAAAREEGAGLIVTGSYHAHKFGRHQIGRTLDTLLSQARVPLLICR